MTDAPFAPLKQKRGGMVKVLLVDDSSIVRERLKAMLSKVPKVETISQAKDQLEAVELLKKLNPEVIVLDIQMPGGSGIDLLRKVKSREKPPLAILLTNLSDSQYRKKCMDAGADFFFDKSTEFDKVAEVLRQLS
jgi:DNA-binding NarL/FixJ family response regulator